MQLTEETVNKYKQDAPELLDAVSSGEADYIMKRDDKTDYCIKYDNGWCGIHGAYGTDYLGDACHFFPRVTRKVGDTHTMTASLSCPEVVRLAVMQPGAFVRQQGMTDRLPHSLKDYSREALSDEQVLAVNQAFIDAVNDEQVSPARSIARLFVSVESMQRVSEDSWAMAAGYYMKNADSSLPNAEGNAADPFNLLNALQGLIGASKRTARPRLDETLADMETALQVKLNWENLSIQTSEGSLEAYQAMEKEWRKSWGNVFAPVLRRWIQAQLSVALFPFAGFGDNVQDRVSILGVRFATLQLALMSACSVNDGIIDDAQVVRIIQSLSRFLDHLADPTLSMQIYTETGWVRLARLRSLMGDY